MNRIQFIGRTAIIGLVMVMLCLRGYAQRNPIFTQYMFNGLVLNPAYTGTADNLVFTASIRSQWTGIYGAPQTQLFTAHSPLHSSNSAAGMVAVHDKAGAIRQTMVYGTYAYYIQVSKEGRISVGMQAGGTYYKANLSELTILQEQNLTDAAFSTNDQSFMPNLGIGGYYYTKATYVGLSMPTIINNKWGVVRGEGENYAQVRHYYLTAGHVFDLSPFLKLKPNVLLKWVEGSSFQYDVNANLYIREVAWVGLSYRMQDSMDALLQINLDERLSFGYSYGYPISSVSQVQSGTHEVVLTYRVKQQKKPVSHLPRYF